MESCISILAPAWGASGLFVVGSSDVILFQFSPPRGGRQEAQAEAISYAIFQFSPPRGGRRSPTCASPFRADFNSRPRVGGVHTGTLLRAEIYDISILAPAWGASAGLKPRGHVAGISILAPAWGASKGYARFTGGFAISILAPAWGASTSTASGAAAWLFQFSPPRGGRLKYKRAYYNVDYFNSRPRVGGVRRERRPAFKLRAISILAPAWGASGGKRRDDVIDNQFQFSPPRGGRRAVIDGHGAGLLISILAPAWGASGSSSGYRWRS